MNLEILMGNLNAPTKSERLCALKEIIELHKNGTLPMPTPTKSVNNHIHTTYSFSPYSPTKAVYMAFSAGLKTAGIMDHDSIAGAKEFIEAGEIAGIATTVGFETRVKMEGSKFYNRRFNNPDQPKVAYVACHGVPHQNIDKVQEFITPFRNKRNIRNKKQVEKINQIIKQSGIVLSFEDDVVPCSKSLEGGSITERHILYALSLKLIKTFDKGQNLVNFLKNDLSIDISKKVEEKLLDTSDKFYEYNLLGALKSNLVPKFFIEADDECPTAKQFVEFVDSIGAISAYAYLGDVEESVTGDKKAQKFEDEFLDDLLIELKDFGFKSVTFMPTRNTKEQLNKLMQQCKNLDFFQICGEDVNSPHQSFVCNELIKPEFSHLITATWALIGHEKEATKDLNNALFSPQFILKEPNLYKRIDYLYNKGIE